MRLSSFGECVLTKPIGFDVPVNDVDDDGVEQAAKQSIHSNDIVRHKQKSHPIAEMAFHSEQPR